MMDTKTEEKTTRKESSNSTALWTWSLIIAISLARVGSGLFISIHGPTLLSLAENVDKDVTAVSWLFAGRSAGVLAGGIATGFIMKKTDAIYSFGVTSFLLAVCITATPFITDLWLLVVVVLLGGVAFGYLDAGMQALILQLWGERESRPHIAAYHFTIALGAFFAPLLAQPFIDDNEQDICPENITSEKCRDESDTFTTVATSISDYFFTTDGYAGGVSSIVWPYVITGVFLVAVSLFFIFLGIQKVEDRVRTNKNEVNEAREEERFGQVFFLFVLVCFYYFFCVAGESAYQSYIYSVSVCSGLCFSSDAGTWINSLYWLGFGSGRLSGIYVMKKIKPKTVIIGDLCGTILTMTIVSIFGERSAGVTWAVTFLFGYFQATIYPAGVSWTSQYTNVSGHYIFIFSAGQALGSMILLPFGGFLFDKNPFSVMYLILGCTICNAIFFAAMVVRVKFQYGGAKTVGEKIDDISTISKL